MANEIVGLEKDGNDKIRVCFYYPISSPASVAGSTPTVTPAASAPQIAQDTWQQAKLDALDAGDAAFETVTVKIPDGMTAAELATRVQEIYADRQTEFINEYNAKYEFAGATVDAPA